jgi:hypothetical protein
VTNSIIFGARRIWSRIEVAVEDYSVRTGIVHIAVGNDNSLKSAVAVKSCLVRLLDKQNSLYDNTASKSRVGSSSYYAIADDHTFGCVGGVVNNLTCCVLQEMFRIGFGKANRRHTNRNMVVDSRLAVITGY